ncbi:MAG: ribosome maturation factor RimM [Syntrophales bacterium]|jgi:16S rRNA processing protein RimM
MRSNFIEIGRISRPQGLKGQLKGVFYLQSPDLLGAIEDVVLRMDRGPENTYRVISMKFAGRGFIMGLEGIGDRSSAEKLIGAKILIPADKLPPLPDGEYYWRDLIGMTIVTEDDQILGRISGIFPTGGNDVFICEGADREILLPVIDDVIRRIDISRHTVIVRLLEGL